MAELKNGGAKDAEPQYNHLTAVRGHQHLFLRFGLGLFLRESLHVSHTFLLSVNQRVNPMDILTHRIQWSCSFLMGVHSSSTASNFSSLLYRTSFNYNGQGLVYVPEHINTQLHSRFTDSVSDLRSPMCPRWRHRMIIKVDACTYNCFFGISFSLNSHARSHNLLPLL